MYTRRSRRIPTHTRRGKRIPTHMHASVGIRLLRRLCVCVCVIGNSSATTRVCAGIRLLRRQNSPKHTTLIQIFPNFIIRTQI